MISELCRWPTVVWAGMITAVWVTLAVLTITDNKPCPKWMVKAGKYFTEYFDLHSEIKKKQKRSKR